MLALLGGPPAVLGFVVCQGSGVCGGAPGKQLLFAFRCFCLCLSWSSITSGDCGRDGAGRNSPIELSYLLITGCLLAVLGLLKLLSATLPTHAPLGF